MPKRVPSVDPRINVSVSRVLRARAKKKAEGEGKNMSQLVVALLKDYVGVAKEKKAA